MHAIVSQLFWLQVNEKFMLQLRWVSSAVNKEADDLTRQAVGEHVRLTSSAFASIWEIWGGRYRPNGHPSLSAMGAGKRQPSSPEAAILF